MPRPRTHTKRATLECVCHLQDVRRPIGQTPSGRVTQVPVACRLDVLQIVAGDLSTWSRDPMFVTCADCLRVIRESRNVPAGAS